MPWNQNPDYADLCPFPCYKYAYYLLRLLSQLITQMIYSQPPYMLSSETRGY